jgi:hypothetical protein
MRKMLVVRDAAIHPTMYRTADQQQSIIWPKMSIMLRLRKIYPEAYSTPKPLSGKQTTELEILHAP